MRNRQYSSYRGAGREHPVRAYIASILGTICLVSCIYMIYGAYKNGGQAEPRHAAVVFVCLVLSLVGLILAILSRREPDRHYLFSYVGMALNAFVVVICALIMYLGLL